jgi:DNA-binding NtrC family response regulator
MAQILIVDDHVALRSAIARLLALSGHVVLEASGAASARAILAGQPVDLVLTDVRMPGARGLAFVEELVGKPFPVVVMSGSSPLFPETCQKLRALGVRDIIEKPFGRDVLLAVLGPVLAGTGEQKAG